MSKLTTARLISFGDWLKTARLSRGLSMKALAQKSGIAQSMVSMLESGERNARRDNIERIAAALTFEDTDEETARHLLADGLRSAGFLPDTNDLSYLPVQEDEAEVLAYYRNMPPELRAAARRMLKGLFADDDAEDRAEGRVGKRAE